MGYEIKYTRDVSEKMMDELMNGAFAPFVDFVKEKKDDLALCFRGSNPNAEKVNIYKHNFSIWELSFQNQKPCVTVNLDLARFIEHWDKDVAEKLMNMGFCGKGINNFEEITQKKELVYQRPQNSKNNKYEYHAIDLTYEIEIRDKTISDEEKKKLKKIVKESYDILSEALSNYLNTKNPINYIKKYYFEGREKISYKSNRQIRLEKKVQQEIFINNHTFNDGLFIYDLEFHQPQKGKGNSVPKNNEPDMLGIRFEGNQMVSICLIEVKSTESAIKGDHGVANHLRGMQDYINSKDLMEDRKEEAYRILNQYKELKLYGMGEREFGEDDFKVLNKEIIFIFTNKVSIESIIKGEVKMGNKVLQNPLVKDILEGFEEYKNVKIGPIGEKIDSVMRKY